MKRTIVATLCSALILAGCATTYEIDPVAGENQSIRYVQGQATTFQQGRNGAVQVTPIAVSEKGRLVFGVAAFNHSQEAANFGVENVSAQSAGQPLRVFSAAELERMARNDAMIAALIVGAAGVAAAAAAADGPTYTSTMTTPRGVYRYEATDRVAQSLAVGAATAGTALSLHQINANLDATLAAVQHQVLQTTTIDPDSSYGGQVITDRVAIPSDGPLDALLRINWNDDVYEFRWDVSKAQ